MLLKKGSKGNEVKNIQQALGINADGIYGSQTAAHVEAYQSKKSFDVTGKVTEELYIIMVGAKPIPSHDEFITVWGIKQDNDSTTSEVYIDGVQQFYSIEDEYREKKVHGETRVPDGIRKLALRHSPKFSKEYLVNPDGSFEIVRAKHATQEQKDLWKPHQLIWMTDVPNFEFILLHWGNTDDSTNGCLCVGTIPGILKGQAAVLSSRSCYKKWYPTMAKRIAKGGVNIEYKRDHLNDA